MTRLSSSFVLRGVQGWRPRGRPLWLAGGVALLSALERWIPVASALALPTMGLPTAVSIGLGGAAVMALRGAVQQQASRDFRVSFADHTAEVFSTRSAMSGPGGSSDQVQSAWYVASQAAARFASDQVPGMAGNLVALFTLLPVFVLHSSARATLLLLPLVGIAAAAAFAVRSAARGATDRSWAASHVMVDQVSALLRAHQELAAAGQAAPHARSVKSASKDWADAMLRADRISALGGRLPIAIGLAAALLVAWWWLRDQPTTLLVGVSQGLMMATGASIAASLARGVVESGRARRDIDALFAAIDGAGVEVSANQGAAPLPLDATIRFDDVSYAYPNASRVAAPALEHVTFCWNPGECLALTGANGSGKSTIVRLLLRLADVDDGSIRVGTEELASGDLLRWRGGIAWLPQRPYLPARGTVRDAMMLTGRAEPESMVEALSEMGVLAVLERHCPDDPAATPIEVLSAGERQKVAIARVLARNAPILLLDEPDAYLDEDGLSRLMSSIRARTRTQRVLFVAHSRRMLGCADRVVDLNRPGVPVLVQEACA